MSCSTFSAHDVAQRGSNVRNISGGVWFKTQETTKQQQTPLQRRRPSTLFRLHQNKKQARLLLESVA
jgi:hypothetical protein